MKLPNIFKRKHKHKWQIRGRNRWGLETYRVCTKCGEAQERVNKPNQFDLFLKCERIKELDAQFDENNQYIF